MLKKHHSRLCESFKWYKNWHDHPQHQDMHWASFFVAVLLTLSALTGSDGIFYINRVSAQTTVSIGNVDWGVDADASGWNQGINLSSVTFNGNQLCLYSNAHSVLTPNPDPYPNGTNVLEGNFWIFAYVNGQWRAGTYEYFRNGDTDACQNNDGVNSYGYLGGANRNPALGSSWTPTPGTTYGFMASALARNNAVTGSNGNIRSNIVMAQWPGNAGSSGGFDLSTPNNTFYSKLSNYATEAKNRNIFTLLTVYNMWMNNSSEGWGLNPFNPANNINSETDYLDNPDEFAVELIKAILNDMSQNSTSRQFIRNVWQTMVQRLAQNTPDTVLFEPFSETYIEPVISVSDKNAALSQMNSWWNKGKLVDNPPNRSDSIHPQAIYRDYHYNFSAESGVNLIGGNTIVNTDTRCDPPPDNEITVSSNAARDGGGNYLVYDCSSSTAWNSRVITAIQASLGGSQPSAVMGQGTLIGYGGPDFWPNINAGTFLQQLKNAGGNLTFVLAVANPSLVADLPWVKGTGGPGPTSLPPTLTSVSPSSANPGTSITLTGTNLNNCNPGPNDSRCNVMFFDVNGNRSTISGTETSNTTITVVVPNDICFGTGTIRVGEVATPSNDIPFTITGGTGCPEKRYLFFISPNRAPIGTPIILAGQNLSSTVNFKSLSSGTTTSITGILSSDKTEVDIVIPATMPLGDYLVSVGTSSTILSNEIEFKVAAGTYNPGISPTSPPVITGFEPATVSQGGTLEIYGSSLGSTVQFVDASGTTTNVIGWVSSDFSITTVGVPSSLTIGLYTIRIVTPYGTATASDLLTIIESTGPMPQEAEPLEAPKTPSTFQELIGFVFQYAIYLVGIAVFIAFLWGGFLWMTSAANPANIGRAKSMMTNAIIGAILLVSSYVILYTINPELVGGTFTLPGIVAPSPTITPPGGPNLSQAAAQRLINASGVSFSSTNPDCGQPFQAQQNIQDISAGSYPAVCSPTCSASNPCIAGGSSGTINVDPFLLDSLVGLSQQGIAFKVTSLTTGKHSSVGSYHYSGRAADIVPSSPDSSVWLQAVDYLVGRGFNAFCESTSGTPDAFCNLAVTDHIHLQK